jgi:WD40 repeat protein
MKKFRLLSLFIACLCSCSPTEKAMNTTPTPLAKVSPSPEITVTPTITPTPIPVGITEITITPTITLTPIPIGITEIANLGKGSADDIAWSPDGKLYAVGGSLGIHVFDAKTSQEISFIPLEFAFRVGFSPDSQLIGVESADYIRIVSVKDQKVLVEIKGLTAGHIAFSPDSRSFAYVLGCWQQECNDSIHTWDIAANKENFVINIEPATEVITFGQIAFNPNGSALVGAGSNNMVYVWDVSSGKVKFLMKGHAQKVIGVSFGADENKLASYSEDNTVRLWNIETGKLIRTLKIFQGEINNVAFSTDGSSLSVVNKDKLITFDVENGKIINTENYVDVEAVLLKQLRSKDGYIEFVDGMAYSPDGETLAVGSYATSPILLWDISTKKIRATIESTAMQMAYSHKGHLLVSSDKYGNVSIWDTQTNSKIGEITSQAIDGFAFSPDDAVLATSTKGDIQLWDVQDIKSIQSIRTNGEQIKYLSYSAGGDVLSAVIIPGFSVISWDVATEKVVHKFTPPNNPNYEEVVGLHNQTLALFNVTNFDNNTIELWDVNANKQIVILKGIKDYKRPRLAYSLDDSVVLVSYFYGLTFFNANTGKPIFIYDKDVHWVKLAFNPKGQFLAIGDSSGNIRIWDVSRIIQAASSTNP